jgi:hypothetical protein
MTDQWNPISKEEQQYQMANEVDKGYMEESAYQDGMVARAMDLPRARNPYFKNFYELYSAWDDGWFEAVAYTETK